MAYDSFRDKKPILEYELPRHRIYVYPAYDYIDDMLPKEIEETRRKYDEANAVGQFMLFIRHTRDKIFRSYTLKIPVPLESDSLPKLRTKTTRGKA